MNLFEQNNFLGNVIKKGFTALRIIHTGRCGNKEMTNGMKSKSDSTFATQALGYVGSAVTEPFATCVTSLLFGDRRTEPLLKPPSPLGAELEVLWGQHLPTAPLGFPDLE